MFKIFLTICVIVASFIKCEIIDNNSVYIDVEVHRYISLEKSLWKTIANSHDQHEKLVQIHSKHIEFFNDTYAHFDNRKIDFSFYALIGKYSFADAIIDVQREWEFIKTYVLNETFSNDSRRNILSNAEYQLNKTNFRIWNIIHNASLDNNYFEAVKQKAENQSCSTAGTRIIQSNRQLIYQFYNDFSVVHLQTYVLIQLSYMFLTVYETRNYLEEAEQLRNSYKGRVTGIQIKARKVIQTTNGESYMCCPIKDQCISHPTTDSQITNFLQGYVDNEVNLNRDQSCQSSCYAFSKTRNYGCSEETYCHKNKDKRSVCNGVIRDCLFIEGDMTICASETDTNEFTRYTGITFDSGKQIGHCYSYSKTSIKSWWRWFVQCSNCFCYCDDPKNSERHFSLRPVLSSTEENKVITGVLIQKKNGIFQWRITEDSLVSNGLINVTDEWRQAWREWSTLNEFDMNTSVNGLDYYSLTYEHRSINLDTVVVPTGSTITGIRFNTFANHLNLELRATKFDFKSGKLSYVHEWLSNKDPHRSEMKLKNPNIPTEPSTNFVPNNAQNIYVQFQPTDIYKDIAQHTVPFLDSHSINAKKNSYLLSGIGIFWKSEDGSGGIISPKLVSYDFSNHIGLDVDEQQM